MHPLPPLNLNSNNMKKAFILLIMMVAVAGTAAAQGSKWFVSVATGAPYGGPGASMKKNFRRDGLDGTESFAVLFFGGTTKYPVNMWNPSLLLKFGKRLSEKRSWFAVAGLSSSGEAEGYKRNGETGLLFPIFYSTSGTHVTVKYQVLQFGAGYQYHYANADYGNDNGFGENHYHLEQRFGKPGAWHAGVCVQLAPVKEHELLKKLYHNESE
jgi:hypothetical protein